MIASGQSHTREKKFKGEQCKTYMDSGEKVGSVTCTTHPPAAEINAPNKAHKEINSDVARHATIIVVAKITAYRVLNTPTREQSSNG
jgi:hypothetical protein